MTALVLAIVRLGIVVILAESLYYLGARAEITRFLWSRYPRWLDKFMACAACVGTWYGSTLTLGTGFGLGWDFPGLPGTAWHTSVVVGLITLFTTPILAKHHIAALLELEVDAALASPGGSADPATPRERDAPLPLPLPAPDPTVPHKVPKP